MRFFAYICVVGLMGYAALGAIEPNKRQCNCKECKCTEKSNCGCFAKKGCPCGNGQNCGHRLSLPDDESANENLLALNGSAT